MIITFIPTQTNSTLNNLIEELREARFHIKIGPNNELSMSNVLKWVVNAFKPVSGSKASMGSEYQSADSNSRAGKEHIAMLQGATRETTHGNDVAAYSDIPLTSTNDGSSSRCDVTDLKQTADLGVAVCGSLQLEKARQSGVEDTGYSS